MRAPSNKRTDELLRGVHTPSAVRWSKSSVRVTTQSVGIRGDEPHSVEGGEKILFIEWRPAANICEMISTRLLGNENAPLCPPALTDMSWKETRDKSERPAKSSIQTTYRYLTDLETKEGLGDKGMCQSTKREEPEMRC